ncbi:MAG: type II toxin-antitoxin system death-on-curing family toxin [Elusimicrobia bacterium]|nr:type II toxin-antitoxin system death-on-curing family toxin [Elusimicrobiota bacterium]
MIWVKNHPFQNGNKRIAITTLLVFLYKNGKWIKADIYEFYEFAMWVAQSPARMKSEMLTTESRKCFTLWRLIFGLDARRDERSVSSATHKRGATKQTAKYEPPRRGWPLFGSNCVARRSHITADMFASRSLFCSKISSAKV